MNKTSWISVLVICLISNISFSQILYDEYVNTSYANIKSVKIESIVATKSNAYITQFGPEKGDSLSNPVFSMADKDKGLMVDFDILEDTSRDLAFRVIHCDRNWKQSNLLESEYLTITDDLLLDGDRVDNSFNTTVPYFHYNFFFPYHNFELLLSGNYVLQVYDIETETILLQKRFVAVEQLVEIQSKVQRPNLVQYSNEYQQITTKIIPHGFDFSNYDKDLFVVYRQNGRWDQTISGIQPNHISGDGTIVFNDNRNALFLGGNEFRMFYFKNMRLAIAPVDYIHKQAGKYYVQLHPDDDWHAAYTTRTDLNGKFLIREDLYPNSCDYTADYAEVRFTLPYHKTMNDTLNMYVFGEFNDWKLTDENKMTYNIEKQQYEASILMKQGYYAYTYILASDDFKTIDYTSIDGSFYQTENEYEIFVYYFDYAKGYDRCIGYTKINSK